MKDNFLHTEFVLWDWKNYSLGVLSYRKTTGYAFVYVVLEELTYMLLSLQVKNSFKKL